MAQFTSVPLCLFFSHVCMLKNSLTVCLTLCFQQEASLHQEFHPHEPVCVLHPEGYLCVHQRRSALRRGGQRPLFCAHRMFPISSLCPLKWCINIAVINVERSC